MDNSSRSVVVGLSILLTLGLAACGEDSPPAEVDSGPVTRVDGGAMDGAVVADDAGPVVTDDAGPVVADDTGPVVADDAGPVVADDAGPVVADDAGPVVADDAGPMGTACTSARGCGFTQFCALTTCGGTSGVCRDVPRRCGGGTEPPVCGCDGTTYASQCEADRARASVASAGACVVSCDESLVTCPGPARPCPRGQVRSVVDGCWGACVVLSTCDCATDAQCPGTNVCREAHCAPR